MLVIRFQRVGRRNDPAYRLVVGEQHSKPQSSGMEVLGSYHPKTKTTILKNERILYWMSKGARVSDSAHNMLIAKGVIQGKKRNVVPVAHAVVSRTAEVAAPVAQAPVDEVQASEEQAEKTESEAAS